MKPRIFIDLDGVLADFVGGAAKVHNKHVNLVTCYGLEECWGLTASEVWEPLDYDFWVNLEPTEEADQIVDLCSQIIGENNCCVLTNPCKTSGCIDGKRDWIEKCYPQFRERFLIGSAKHFCAHPYSFLIDDSEYNVTMFNEYGGRAFLFPRPWNVKKSLDKTSVTMDNLRGELYRFAYGSD